MKCIIVSNGSIIDYNWAENIIEKNDLIICADGGAKHLFKMNINPNIIVGDLDSIDWKTKSYYKKQGVEFIKFPKEKDFTDTELAVEYAIKYGANEITFLGVMGSRMDHTLANIALLLPLCLKNINAKIIDEKNEIIAVNKSTTLNGKIGELLSIIPISEKVEGLTLSGLEYPLKNANIAFGSSICVSNKFMSDTVNIEFGLGTMLIIKSRD